MFTELLPVLKDRVVILTIARLDANLLRVNVIPQKRKPDKENDAADNALATPLSVTASAEELDREFAQQVRNFSGSYERAAANIQQIESAHAAAVKAAQEEAREARKQKATHVKPASQPTTDTPAPAADKPVVTGKPQSTSAPVMQSLFDSESPETEAAANTESKETAVPEALSHQMPAAEPSREIANRMPAVQQESARQAAPAKSEVVICQICQSPILSTQKQHPLMPLPAHASATDCQQARAAAR
jgi:PRTRC genetic system protein E